MARWNSYHPVRLDSGLVRRSERGAQVPSLNGPLSGGWSKKFRGLRVNPVSKPTKALPQSGERCLEQRVAMRVKISTCETDGFVRGDPLTFKADALGRAIIKIAD